MSISTRALRDLLIIIVGAILLSLVLKTFVFQLFLVPSVSMSPTIVPGDRIIATQIIRGDNIERGDIIVFDDPGKWISDSEYTPSPNSFVNFLSYLGLAPSTSDHYLVKRVIAVGGDKISCCDEQGRIQVNGVSIDETYLPQGVAPSDMTFDVTVPAGSVWVMGDNRINSLDSRYHMEEPGMGTVSEDLIFGKVVGRMLPFSSAGKMNDESSVFDAVPNAS